MPTPIDRAALPADIRAAGPETRKVYTAALEFEQTLLRELARSLVDSAQPEDGDASAGAGLYREQLPDALAQSLAAAGGVGLARELTRTLTS
jgi:Rod binding domain-containing protein